MREACLIIDWNNQGTKRTLEHTPNDVLFLRSAEEWEAWLKSNYACSSGVWLRIQKKGSAEKSLTYAEALDVALCHGWIDRQKNRHDEISWLQKFTPRRPQSGWSKKNTEHAERLIRTGKMKPAGLAEIEAAKKDGRWKAAYDSPSNANKTNLYSIAYRLQTARTPATREKRMNTILEMMAKGEKFH